MTTVIGRARTRIVQWLDRYEPRSLSDAELDAMWARAKVRAAAWRAYVDERTRELQAERAGTTGSGGSGERGAE